MHASCHGNRSGEAFLKDCVKHLECAKLRERERVKEKGRRVLDDCPSFHPNHLLSGISVNDVGKPCTIWLQVKDSISINQATQLEVMK